MQELTGGEVVDLGQIQTDVSNLKTQAQDLQDQIDALAMVPDMSPQHAFELSLVTRADDYRVVCRASREGADQA